MKKLKKRFIVPVVVFILGMCALIGTIYNGSVVKTKI
jgi:hypothetical protein